MDLRLRPGCLCIHFRLYAYAGVCSAFCGEFALNASTTRFHHVQIKVVLDTPFVMLASGPVSIVHPVLNNMPFAPYLQKLAKKAVDNLERQTGSRSFNGLHLRVEKDAVVLYERMGGQEAVWAMYDEGLQRIGINRSEPLYVASGVLTGAPAAGTMLGMPWYQFCEEVSCGHLLFVPVCVAFCVCDDLPFLLCCDAFHRCCCTQACTRSLAHRRIRAAADCTIQVTRTLSFLDMSVNAVCLHSGIWLLPRSQPGGAQELCGCCFSVRSPRMLVSMCARATNDEFLGL